MRKHLIVTFGLFLSVVISTAVQAQVTTYPNGRTYNRDIRNVLARIDNKTGTFRNEVMRSINRTDIYSNRDERIDNLLDRFTTATGAVRNAYDARRDASVEVRDLLERASAIDRFMARNTTNCRATTQWNSLRADLDTLAQYYNVSWNWNSTGTGEVYGNTGGNYGNTGGYNRGGGLDVRLTGTYRLNTTLSDNVKDVLDRSLRNSSTSQTYRPNLERRMTSPDMLAIEKTGNHITMASTLAPQVAFDADNVPRTETNDRGRTMTTTVSSDRNGLNIRYQGETSNDFNLTFTPLGNGQLRVVRTLYLANRNQAVTVDSVYDKIDQVARWESVNTGGNVGYNNGNIPNYNGNTGYENTFVVPNGTQLTAQLENRIGTRISQPGDRFTMRVTSPGPYRGAIIQGHVANTATSDRLTGRANISLDFDSIQVNDGRTSRFEGMVNSVRTLSGQSLNVDNEGAVQDKNQTTKTVTRAGIGAVIGALIGAAAGGGQGAAIGAAVGAGAGAGSVLIQGRDNIDLEQGSEFVLTASAPSNVGLIR